MKSPSGCDAIVAGAGPAGAAAATHLAAAGLHVIVADSRAFPRDKVCGDFVSPVAIRELASLGITRRPEWRRSTAIRSAAVHLDGEHLLTGPIPRQRGLPASGRVIPRKILDAWLVAGAREAGARVLERSRVVGFAAERSGIAVAVQDPEGERRLRARVLIGADGSSSLVARALRGDGDHDRIIAIRGYFEDVKGPVDRADLYFASDSFPGYCWVFPSGGGGANVGVGMILETLPPSRQHLRALLLRSIDEDAALKNRLRGARLATPIVGWPLTTYNPRLPVAGDHVLLAGDAAGLINPLNGEGIQYALLSGRWAAETVVACAANRDFSGRALGAYAARIDHELRYDLSLSRTIVQLIRNRALNPLWLEALRIIAAAARNDPEYARITGGVLAGILPARNLLGMKVVRDTVQQAALRLGIRAVAGLSLRPNDLATIGLRLSDATVDIASTILNHRADAERWGSELVTSTIDVASEAFRRASASARSGLRARQ
jgi:geranylgeranyl reductase family protein